MLVLHVRAPGAEDWVREATRPEQLAPLRLQSVSSVETGLARIAGGGVDVILLDLTGEGNSPDLRILREVRRQANGIPILMAVSHGAVVSDIDERILTRSDARRFRELLRHAVQAGTARTEAAKPSVREAKVIGFLGVKGGVGTTSTALNVAAAMARRYRVAIAEVGSDWDLLGERLRSAGEPQQDLLVAQPGGAAIEARLCNVDKLLNLRLLTMPASAGPSVSFTADHVRSLVQGLRRNARIVILDLTFGRGEALRAAGRETDLMVLVAEQTPAALQASKRVFETLLDWGTPKDTVCAVLVNRCATSNPQPVEAMKSQIPVPVLAVLPPAADMVVQSETARKAVAAIQPDSLVCHSYAALGEALETKLAE